MEFLDNLSSGQLLNTQLKLNEYWSDYEDEFERLNRGSIENEKERALIIEKIVLPIVSKNYEHRANVDLLANFFANLQTCIDNGICEKRVSKKFFGEYASSLLFMVPILRIELRII